MIKRLQLRGISHAPSDRMTSDGGVAESLNAYLQDNETAPAIAPRDVAGLQGLPISGDSLRAIYIHRINGKNLFIYAQRIGNRDKILAYPGALDVYDPGEGSGEYIKEDSIAAIGNTLVFSMTTHSCYAVWRGSAYEYLGENLPVPQIEVVPICYLGTGAQLFSNVPIYASDSAPTEDLYKADSAAWTKQLDLSVDERSDEYKTIMNAFWSGMQESILGSKYFRHPVYVRFALKLNDNSYVRHTVPILIGGGVKRCFESTMRYTVDTSTSQGVKKYSTVINIQGGKAYRIKARLNNADELAKWKDVIQSVEMFVSEPLIYPDLNAHVVQVGDTNTTTSGRQTVSSMSITFQDKQDSTEETQSIESMLLNGSRLFYKAKSYSVDNLSEIAEGTEIDNSKDLSYTERLYTQDNLSDDYRSNNDYVAERSKVINRRLLSMGMTEHFGRGMQYAYNLVPVTEDYLSYQFCYEIKDNNGSVHYVRSRDTLQTPVLSGKAFGSRDEDVTFSSDICQLLFYPDTRCVAVWVKHVNGVIRLPMRAHPYISMAYWLGDISKTLRELTYSNNLTLPDEDRIGTSYKFNYLFQTSVNNPFYYPLSGRIRFSSVLMEVASITTALSEGQFGQFDLYAFTDTGIFVLSPNNQGEYLNLVPLSRDVCLSAHSVACLDRAIVFITDKGVMIMDGSQINCISENMIGRISAVDPLISETVTRITGEAAYADALNDTMPFMDFMSGSRIAYDYTGSRLIFFRTDCSYEYVYMMRTATWHKYVMPLQLESQSAVDVRVLNSFPDCYTFVAEVNRLHLYDWSTVLDATDNSELMTSITITRPFDLGEPDVLKSISCIRIRGDYEKRKPVPIRYLKCLSAPEAHNDIKTVLGQFGLFVTDEQITNLVSGVDMEVAALSVLDADYMLMMLNGLKNSSFAYRYLPGDTTIPSVQYMLLGSQDGRHFAVLDSLRGKSWKIFRIAIVSRLTDTERISWIDVDYETRETTRLR